MVDVVKGQGIRVSLTLLLCRIVCLDVSDLKYVKPCVYFASENIKQISVVSEIIVSD
jgi:hypothetical protein